MLKNRHHQHVAATWVIKWSISNEGKITIQTNFCLFSNINLHSHADAFNYTQTVYLFIFAHCYGSSNSFNHWTQKICWATSHFPVTDQTVVERHKLLYCLKHLFHWFCTFCYFPCQWNCFPLTKAHKHQHCKQALTMFSLMFLDKNRDLEKFILNSIVTC